MRAFAGKTAKVVFVVVTASLGWYLGTLIGSQFFESKATGPTLGFVLGVALGVSAITLSPRK
ncbi:hypothetical protein ACTOB_000922 [Actinoplanes oblitus]|uniref:AtpZ/AtpI family protein n=1 Tax=Actinoplanes oblitus TaxID=3040509 RepID=A0ABY8WHQ0_9ACTN|nr:hypothetical protein [Actinoplanes oblitus]WIM97406.1 hypothetical protein ACTOB_000922 [Actinoplanes oblitus]